ncbi:Zinc finger protein 367 [Araneus ventricosus]|uniref:Zinc finger protein 367 n=1 Tax=Araneus ventricosus TaxID=182803 RepID=A0A4Y2EL29_ARAVE|nr:Zinc finger protein 367 [Araneus ventricosus]
MKKYRCDFPDCTKCFKQSSQLKNHLLLHSTEKPFICPAEGCLVRYTHSGQSHSSLKLIKQPETAEEIRHRFYRNVENLTEAAKKWFEVYLSKRERKLPPASIKIRRFDDVKSLQEILEYSIMKVTDSEEDISQDGIMKVSDSKEEIHQDENMLQEIQDGLLFYSFLKDLCQNGGDSKALFKKSCHAVIIPN